MEKHEQAFQAAKQKHKHAKSFRPYMRDVGPAAPFEAPPREIRGWTFNDGQSILSGFHWVTVSGVLSPCGYMTRGAARSVLRAVIADAEMENGE